MRIVQVSGSQYMHESMYHPTDEFREVTAVLDNVPEHWRDYAPLGIHAFTVSANLGIVGLNDITLADMCNASEEILAAAWA